MIELFELVSVEEKTVVWSEFCEHHYSPESFTTQESSEENHEPPTVAVWLSLMNMLESNSGQPRGEKQMKDTPKTYGMLARDESKDSQAFTYVLSAEAETEGTARALIENLAKKLKFVVDGSRTYIVMQPSPRRLEKDPDTVASESRTPMALEVENQMRKDAKSGAPRK